MYADTVSVQKGGRAEQGSVQKGGVCRECFPCQPRSPTSTVPLFALLSPFPPSSFTPVAPAPAFAFLCFLPFLPSPPLFLATTFYLFAPSPCIPHSYCPSHMRVDSRMPCASMAKPTVKTPTVPDGRCACRSWKCSQRSYAPSMAGRWSCGRW